MAKEKYIVIRNFTDLEDKNKKYEVNDPFPKPANKKVSEDRLRELSSADNRQGKVLIQKVEPEPKPKKVGDEN